MVVGSGSMREVWVAGTFDGLHEGHQQLFDDALQLSQPIGVFINSDELIINRKGRIIMNSYEERERMVEQFFESRNTTYYIRPLRCLEVMKKTLVKEQPALLHGDDYNIRSLSELYGVDEDWWRKHNILPLFSPRQAGISSTDLRAKQ